MIARVPPLLFWLTAALASVSLGVAAGPVFWRLSGDAGHIRAAPAPGPAPEAPALDLGPILAFAPFGSTEPIADAAPVVAGETSLGLTLLGVTIAIPDTDSRAIIKGGDDGVQSFGIGAPITATAELAEVHPGYVMLKVGDQLETLSFVKPGRTAAPTSKGVDLKNLIPQAGQSAATTPGNEPDAVIARYRAAIQQNAQGVLDRLGLEVTDRGYRISDKASPGVRQAGFKPGDIVTTVNGQKVGDMAADQRYFDEVAASGRARVELQRDGAVIVMTFPLR